MSEISYVILFSLLGGVVSLLGGIVLFSGKKRANNLAIYATPFAAGALLAAAFLELLKEGMHAGDPEQVLMWALGGMVVFFLLESTLMWFHHHHEHNEDRIDPAIPLIITGDTLHNFIDGIAIAAAFLINVPTGIVTTLAVAAHEIPQEIGDMGLLLSKGYSRKRVLIINILSAFVTTISAVIFFTIAESNAALIAALAGLTAGFFIYIAASDIIPTIHEAQDKRTLNIKSGLLILGVLVVGVTTTSMHQYIDQAADNHGTETHHQHADEH